MQLGLGMVVVNEKREGPFMRTDINKFFTVRYQFPHQCKGRVLAQIVYKFAERINGLVHALRQRKLVLSPKLITRLRRHVIPLASVCPSA